MSFSRLSSPPVIALAFVATLSVAMTDDWAPVDVWYMVLELAAALVAVTYLLAHCILRLGLLERQSDAGLLERIGKVLRLPAIAGVIMFLVITIDPHVSVAAFPADKLQPAHWPQHEWDWLMWAEFSYPFNWSGSPAASIPCGFTPAGLPVGLQIVGRRFDDLGVLQASAAFEEARPWAQHRPPLAQ